MTSVDAIFAKRPYLGCSCHECGGIAQDGSPPGTWFNACPQCHNKRCPKCDNHRFKCTGSNKPGQVGELEQVSK